MTPVVLTAESETRLAVLRRSILRSRAFGLHLVCAEPPAYSEVLRRLQAWSDAGEVPRLDFWTAPGLMERLARSPIEPASRGVVVFETDALFAGAAPLIAGLNLARDRLPKLIDGPLVLVLHADRLVDLARAAPDFYDVRVSTIDVAAEPGIDPTHLAPLELPATEWSGTRVPVESLQAEAARLRSMAAEVPADALANAWLKLGQSFYESNEHGEARAAALKAIELAQPLRYVAVIARAYLFLGRVALMRSRLDEARQETSKALLLFREIGDVLGESHCISNQGDIALARSDYDEARHRYNEALPLLRQVGNVLGEANVTGCLGDIARQCLKLDEAGHRYDEALHLHRRVKDTLGEANCLHRRGSLAAIRKDHDEARLDFGNAMQLYKSIGSAQGEANCLFSTGVFALAAADNKEALRFFEESLPLFRRLGDIPGEGRCLLGLGDVARARGNKDEARQRYAEAIEIFGRISAPQSLGLIHLRLANLLDGPERATHLAAARAAWQSIGRPDLIARLDAESGG